jgi:2,4-dienoyl-CoA reductase-like NADH-dependent reductase (Old Yellow Enzyme family)
MDRVRDSFVRAAQMAHEAGFDLLQLHFAHGYLLAGFLSPLTNLRDDDYGGDPERRARFPIEVFDAVRAAWPDRLPVFLRLSVTDWVDGGWDIEQSIALAKLLRDHGVDLIDCSSGGNIPTATIPVAPGYQVPFAERIRRDARIPTGAVGMITSPEQAEAILVRGEADCVLLARELLRDPYWPLHAAAELDQAISWPVQYLRAAPHGSMPRA